jgi:phytoene synthase
VTPANPERQRGGRADPLAAARGSPAALASSHTYCRRLARRAASSFPLAFRLLPRAERDATTALYAFCRATDDLADSPGDSAAKRAALGDWRARLDAALRGVYTHRLHAALHHAVRTFGVSPGYLHDVIDGVETDQGPVAFGTFAELYRYCYRVASAVGLACVPIWGLRPGADPEAAKGSAEAAGVAFQLTNILRDLGEDRSRGRVYLPQDELERFGSPPEAWRAGDPAFRELMRFQVSRARGYYDRGEPLAGLLSPAGRAVFRVMAGVYRRLLDEIERRDFDVFARRVRVGRLTKLRLFLSAWPVKWGWV